MVIEAADLLFHCRHADTRQQQVRRENSFGLSRMSREFDKMVPRDSLLVGVPLLESAAVFQSARVCVRDPKNSDVSHFKLGRSVSGSREVWQESRIMMALSQEDQSLQRQIS